MLAANPIPHSRPSIGPEEREAIASLVDSLALADGEEIARFEKEMAAWIGVQHGVATHCGSSGLHLALLALGVGPGDEVIIPSYTSAALPNAIHNAGARPVLADISLEDLNLTPKTIEPRLTSRTKALIVTHTHGIPSDMTAIKGLGLFVIEDLAQSLGASCGTVRVGSLGDIAVGTFYATKLMMSIDGGMVLTSNLRWSEVARDLRYYGGKLGYRPRFNYKMTNLAAAIGLVQLKKLDGFLAARARIAESYDTVLNKHGFTCFPGKMAGRSRVFYRYCVLMAKRDDFIQAMMERGVRCGHGMLEPLHRGFGEADCNYPNSTLAADQLVSIPIYPGLSADEQERIIDALDHCLGPV